MALIAVSVGDVIEYTPESDPAKGTPDATVFELGLLDVFVQAHVYDRSLSFAEVNGQPVTQLQMNQVNVEAVRFGLKGWRNFRDNKGNDVKFETVKRVVNGREYVVASDGTLQRLGIQLIRDLAGKIKEMNNVTAAEAKNFAVA